MRLYLLCAAAAFATFGAAACIQGETTSDNSWRYVPSTPDEHWDKDCSGEEWFNGCDDCNPCTWDVWCDPEEWSAFVPPACKDVATSDTAQCVHFDLTTPQGQINDCFPIAPVTDVRAGKCCAGTCTDNAESCDLVNYESFDLRPGESRTEK